MHVDVPGFADHRGADALPGEEGGEARPSAHTDDELGGIDPSRELHESGGRGVPDDLVIGAAEAFDEGALRGQRGRVGFCEPVGIRHVDREQLAAAGAGRDPGAASDQCVTFRPARQRDHDPLAGLPFFGDPVFRAIILQGDVHLVGQPQQGEFAEGGEIAQTEVIGQRRVDGAGRVDETAGEPRAQCLRGQIDNLDLLGGAEDGVGDGLSLHDSGDLVDHVVE